MTTTREPWRIIVTRPDGSRVITYRTPDGQLDDPADGTPAVVELARDGRVLRTEHWAEGAPQRSPAAT